MILINLIAKHAFNKEKEVAGITLALGHQLWTIEGLRIVVTCIDRDITPISDVGGSYPDRYERLHGLIQRVDAGSGARPAARAGAAGARCGAPPG